MVLYYIVSFFIIGICLGSFYNVVGYRLPNNMSVVKPSSHCPNCNHKLKPLELIPVFSYMFLGGKCHSCKKKIAIFYPMMELLTGILFAFSYYYFRFSYEFVIALVVVSMLVIIIISDFKYYIISDEVLIVSAIIIILVKLFESGAPGVLDSVLNGVYAFTTIYIFMLLGNFIFKKESMGGGDIKLMAVIGLTVGYLNSILVFVFSAFLALPFALLCLMKKKEHVIPYGPFIALSFTILYFLQINFNDFINNLINLY